ncbi:MAG: AmmeMemoRadiSam system protein B [Planctomycetota bacterium]|nr:MAG: AmmeMemoRadiSam system protein B [Planctomycetota bacterium]
MAVITGRQRVRPPAVAGMFYPASPLELQRMVDAFLAAADPPAIPVPKALIAPHAGYVYSGPIAATAYKTLWPARSTIRRVVLFGPSHYVPLVGLASSSADVFSTPLGGVPVDREAVAAAERLPQVAPLDEAHRREHSLEVHLPFLQRVLEEFTLVPFAVGQASTADVAAVIQVLWGGPETLIVVSSDLSHYLDYWTARQVDAETSRLIEACRYDALSGDRACGYAGIRGLLAVAAERGLTVRTLDLRNSGDTAGDKSQVVGYGAYAVY